MATTINLEDGELAAVVRNDGNIEIRAGGVNSNAQAIDPANKSAFALIMALPFLLTDDEFVFDLERAMLRGGFQ